MWISSAWQHGVLALKQEYAGREATVTADPRAVLFARLGLAEEAVLQALKNKTLGEDLAAAVAQVCLWCYSLVSVAALAVL